MSSLLEESWETYRENIRLVLLFSIPFIIAFLIPLLAPLPTYVSAGGIFLRTASLFLNISAIGVVVIIGSVVLSLLFLSFAFVAISLIVKAKRTYTKHPASVLREVEKYTARVFVVLLAYTLLIAGINVLSYFMGLEQVLTPLLGFFLFMAIFYAPTAIVVDNRRIAQALKQSIYMVAKRPQYFLMWVVAITLVVGVLDYVIIHVTNALAQARGTLLSGYIFLVVNSLFVLPYFIIFQAEAYMKRFSLLKH